MSIKKKAESVDQYFQNAIQKAEEILEDYSDAFSNIEEVLALSDAELRSYGDLTKNEIKALRSRELVTFGRDAQANVVLLTKALLILNKLVEEYENTGSADLPPHITKISEKIKLLDKNDDVFGQFQRNFISVFPEAKQRTIKTKLRAVRGKLDTMREIGYAARAVSVVKALARSADINEIKDLLDGVNKTAFKSLMDAEDTLTGYCAVTNPTRSDRPLQKVLTKVAKAYGTATKTANESAELKGALAALKTIREDTNLSVSQKITKQQEILDRASDLPESMKEVIKVLNEANVLVSDGENATQIGGELGLTKEQEDAMLSTGMTIISAGAGSGKTRVLSGKVAHLIKEQSADPYSIIACSFSRKSAEDLREKIVSATGKDLRNVDYTTIGRTTHSIAIEMVNRFDPEAGSLAIVDEFEQNDILTRAIKLAKNTPISSGSVKSESFFKDKIVPISEAQIKNNVRILSLLFSVERWREGRGYSKDDSQSTRLQGIRKQVVNKQSVTDTDQEFIEALLRTNRGKKVLARAFGGSERAIKGYIKSFSLQPTTKKSASAGSTPMWWGLVGAYEGDEVKAPSPRKAQLFITKCKSRMLSPTEAFNKVEGKGNDHEVSAKVYGAYQYLLGAEEKMDFDDVLIRGVNVLNNSKNLAEIKKQYKHIIVDEAQDLNPVQHAFFGLIAGTYKSQAGSHPKKVEKPTLAEGNSFTLIGDENQSIYGFRGASRSEFSDKTSEGFDLKSIGINFRSGESIVNAANMLVNAKEGEGLGLVCVASAKKSSDRIIHDRKKSSGEAARSVAKHIKTMTTSDEVGVRPRSYGIACRTNAEIIPYALALLSEGVPFKSGVNPFQHKTTKAIIRLMGVLTKNPGAHTSAVLNSWKDFGFDFGKGSYTKAVDEVLKQEDKVGQYFAFPETIINLYEKAQEEEPQNEEDKKEVDRALEIITSFMNTVGGDGVLEDILMFNFNLSIWKEVSKENPAKAFDVALGFAPIQEEDYFTGKDGKKLFEILGESGVQVEAIIGEDFETEADEDGAASASNETEDGEALALAPISALRTMFATGQDFDKIFEKIDKMKRDADGSKGSADVDEDVVVLDTVHGWKGLEAEHMYVPMNAGKFPSEKVEFDPIAHESQEQAEKEKAEEEKLLGYVAVTRGMKSVTLLSYEKNDKGEEMQQSEFIAQMGICEESSTRVASALNVLAELSAGVEEDDLTDDEIDEALGIF